MARSESSKGVVLRLALRKASERATLKLSCDEALGRILGRFTQIIAFPHPDWKRDQKHYFAIAWRDATPFRIPIGSAASMDPKAIAVRRSQLLATK